MSFTQNVKAQLAKIENGCNFCDIAELSAIIRLCAVYKEKGIYITTENEDVADRIQMLYEKVFCHGIDYINRNGTFRFGIDTDFFAEHIAQRLMLFGSVKDEIAPMDCCRAAYVRGAFLGGGSVSDPKVRYHMEFDAKHESYANQLEEMLLSMQIIAKTTCRKGHYIVYIKEYESIADTLGAMGAVGLSMELYNVSIEKEIRNRANRQANCEYANIERTTQTAFRQIDAIKKIEKTIGLDKLPQTLRDIAVLRCSYPDESLKELGERLSPPIGKSGVNHRLKRITEISDNL
ncbi:MAG: DNA-binding protein WhiA [Firmicutes bacterium]|nr:DNA-binding protein WhiA [Bacillota bacterium]